MDNYTVRYSLCVVAGVVATIIAALLICGISGVVGFIVGIFVKGLTLASLFVPTVIASVVTIVLFGALAIMLAGIGTVLVANGIGRALEKLRLAEPGSIGNAIQATAQKAQRPETWYLAFSAVFVVLLETPKELNESQNSAKLLIYMFLLALVVFTFCFTRRKRVGYRIAAFVGPLLIFVMYGWTLFAFDGQRRIHFSAAALKLAAVVLSLFSEPNKILLLILPALIALSSFLSIMQEKKP